MNDDTIKLIDTLAAPAGAEKINHIIDGFKTYQILKAALELGLFDYLDQSPTRKSLSDIQGATGIDRRYLPGLMETLLDMGLVAKDQDHYHNSDLARIFLTTSSPNYQGDIIKMVNDSGKWNHLQEKLIHGPRKSYDNTGISWGTLRSLSQRSLQGELQQVSKTIVQWEGFKRAESVLDIGGGHGLYVIALCQVNAGLQGLVFDQAHVTDLTSQFIDQYRLNDRIKVQAGDIVTDTPPGPHDIVIVSHFLYKFSQDLPAMLNKISQSLKPGGLLVSNHWFSPEGASSARPAPSGLPALDKSLHNPGHYICPLEQYAIHLQNAGFSILSMTDIPSSFEGSTLHLAVK